MDVFPVSENEIDEVRKSYGKDAENIEREVQILKDWMRQQQHLPQNAAGDNMLERILLRNKFRMEQAKKKLDNYYTLRGIHRQYFKENSSEVVPSKQASLTSPMPRLTESMQRIFLWRLEDLDPNKFVLADFVTYLCLLTEIEMREDYSVGAIMILDFQEATLEHLTRMNPTDLSKSYMLYSNAYSGRLTEIHIINAPPYITILISIFKMILPEKLFNRIKVHKDLESLSRCVDRKLLPKDYGGQADTVEELKRKLDKKFESYYDFFDANYYVISNEKLRIGDVAQNEAFGVDGTFKKLNLD